MKAPGRQQRRWRSSPGSSRRRPQDSGHGAHWWLLELRWYIPSSGWLHQRSNGLGEGPQEPQQFLGRASPRQGCRRYCLARDLQWSRWHVHARLGQDARQRRASDRRRWTRHHRCCGRQRWESGGRGGCGRAARCFGALLRDDGRLWRCKYRQRWTRSEVSAGRLIRRPSPGHRWPRPKPNIEADPRSVVLLAATEEFQCDASILERSAPSSVSLKPTPTWFRSA